MLKNLTAPAATLLAAVIAGVVTLSIPVIERFTAQDPNNKFSNSEQSPDTVDFLEGVVVKSNPAIPDSSNEGFSEWARQGFSPEAIYKAESDGFVNAITGGNSPPSGADIYQGATQNGLWNCSRIDGRYSAGICPVKKGHYWAVRSRSNHKDGITISWMSVGK